MYSNEKKFDYSLIPDHHLNTIKLYVENGCRMGDCFEAIFAHDLFRAVEFADPEIMDILPTIVCYIINRLPMNCHGSYKKVQTWYESKRSQENG